MKRTSISTLAIVLAAALFVSAPITRGVHRLLIHHYWCPAHHIYEHAVGDAPEVTALSRLVSHGDAVSRSDRDQSVHASCALDRITQLTPTALRDCATSSLVAPRAPPCPKAERARVPEPLLSLAPKLSPPIDPVV
jgi:hypothetical protein